MIRYIENPKGSTKILAELINGFTVELCKSIFENLLLGAPKLSENGSKNSIFSNIKKGINLGINLTKSV